MTTEEVLKHDPTLTEEQAAELADAVNRYAPCQRDMDEVNYRLAEAELEKEEA